MSGPESESVHVSRRFSASPQRVFGAWVNRSLLQLWLAPNAESDPRVGGKFCLEVSKPEGVHVVTGKFLEFIPGERLVMTWVYEGPMAPREKVEALLRVEFREDGAGTRLSLDHEHLTNPNYRDEIRKGAWGKALDALEVVLEGTLSESA